MEYTIKNEKIQVIISDMGAEIQSIKKDGKEYLWNGDKAYWDGRSPILFPYVGRFTEGKYTLGGEEYEMNIHGFARKQEFKVADSSETAICFELEDNDETYKQYPYQFTLKIIYMLVDDTIEISYCVYNQSVDRMYFGIGGHPGFNLPLDDGLDFSDYYLVFENQCRPSRIINTGKCFLSGVDEDYPLNFNKVIPLTHEMFDDDAIVLRNISDKVTLKSDKGSRSVTVHYPDMPYLGLWHAPKTKAPYICIEPWASLPSRQDVVEDFKNKSDLIRLNAGCEYWNSWSITIN